jgi:integrase
MWRNELLALRWRDVDLVLCEAHVSRSLHQLQTGEIVIRPPKSKQGLRTVDLPLSAALLLQDYKDKQAAQRTMLGIQFNENDLIFSDLEGKALLPNTVTHAWIKLVRRTGLKGVRLNDARHTYASLMLKQGVHPKIV